MRNFLFMISLLVRYSLLVVSLLPFVGGVLLWAKNSSQSAKVGPRVSQTENGFGRSVRPRRWTMLVWRYVLLSSIVASAVAERSDTIHSPALA